MSTTKLSFRARALDAAKPMAVFMASELPDLPDFTIINRAVPQMPTGMEKEEETVSICNYCPVSKRAAILEATILAPNLKFDTTISEEYYINALQTSVHSVFTQSINRNTIFNGLLLRG